MCYRISKDKRFVFVFSITIAMYLIRKGFDLKNVCENYWNKNYVVFSFDNTSELHKAINQYIEYTKQNSTIYG